MSKLDRRHDELRAPRREEVYDEPMGTPGVGSDSRADLTGSQADSDATMDPGGVDEDDQHMDEGVGPVPHLNPDMEAYCLDPTEEELQANNIKANRELIHHMEKILRKARETVESESRESTAWFKDTKKHSTAALRPNEMWRMTFNQQEHSGLWEIGLYRVTQALALLQGTGPKELNEFTSGTIFEIAELYGVLSESWGEITPCDMHQGSTTDSE